MGSMEATPVWEVLLKHNPATLNKAVPLRRAVENVLDVSQVSCFPWAQRANIIQMVFVNWLHTYLFKLCWPPNEFSPSISKTFASIVIA